MGVRDGPFHPIQKKYPLVSSSQLNLVNQKMIISRRGWTLKKMFETHQLGMKMLVNYYGFHVESAFRCSPKHQGSNQCHSKAWNQTVRCLFGKRHTAGRLGVTFMVGTNQPPLKWKINQDQSRLSREIIRWDQMKMFQKFNSLQRTNLWLFGDLKLGTSEHRTAVSSRRDLSWQVKPFALASPTGPSLGPLPVVINSQIPGLAFTTTSTPIMARNACITKMQCHCSCHCLPCSTLWLGRLVGHLPTHVTRGAHSTIHPIHMTHATCAMHMSACHVFRTSHRCRSLSGCTHRHGLLHTEAAVVLAFLWPHATSHVLWPVGVSIVFG